MKNVPVLTIIFDILLIIRKSFLYYFDAMMRLLSRRINRYVFKVLYKLGYIGCRNHTNIKNKFFCAEENEKFEFSKPFIPVYQKLPSFVLERCGNFELERNFVSTANDIRIIGKDALPIDEKNNILVFAINSEGYKDIFVHIRLGSLISGLIDRTSGITKIENACSLVHDCTSLFRVWFQVSQLYKSIEWA